MSSQTQLPHHELGHSSTTRLFGRIVLCMLITPALLVVLVWVALAVQHYELSKREWKHVLLLVWLGTLFVSAYMTLPRKRPRRGMLMEFPRAPRTDIQQWEHRNARRIARDAFLQSVVIPLSAGALVLMLYRVVGVALTARDYSTLTFVLWGSMIGLVVRFVYRSWRSAVAFRS